MLLLCAKRLIENNLIKCLEALLGTAGVHGRYPGMRNQTNFYPGPIKPMIMVGHSP